MVFWAFVKASVETIAPFSVIIKFFSSSNSDWAALLLDIIVRYHAVCEETPSSPTKRLYSLIFDISFSVIVEEKLLNKPLIPFFISPLEFWTDIEFRRSAKLLLNIPILFVAPSKSVVIVLNIRLCYNVNCGDWLTLMWS